MYSLRLVTLILWSLSFKSVRAAPSNSGKQFLVIFLESLRDNCQLDLHITTNNTIDVEVKVSAPLRSDIEPESIHHVTKGETVLANMHKELNAIGTDICDHGILVDSTHDISVQAYSQSVSTDEPYSTGGYMVLPISSLGTEYMVVSHCELYSCLMAVTSAVDTSVDIDLKISGNGYITFKFLKYYSGDHLTEDIKAFQILQLQVVQEDLTGTIVRSLHKVAVVVGADWTPIDPPINDGQGDFLIEQMPPLNTWGWEYVLVSFPGRTSKDKVDMVAAEEDAVVTASSGGEFTIPYRTKYAANLLSGASVVIKSTGRLIIAHYSKSPESVGVKNTDPSMVLVPPVDQWKVSYAIVVADLPPTTVSTSLILYASTACKGHVVVSGTTLQASSWKDIDTSGFAQVVASINNGVFWIETTNPDCLGFSGYIYGQSFKSALALPIGGYLYILHKPVTTAPSSSTNTVPFPSSNDITVTSSQVSTLAYANSSPLNNSTPAFVPESPETTAMSSSSLFSEILTGELSTDIPTSMAEVPTIAFSSDKIFRSSDLISTTTVDFQSLNSMSDLTGSKGNPEITITNTMVPLLTETYSDVMSTNITVNQETPVHSPVQTTLNIMSESQSFGTFDVQQMLLTLTKSPEDDSSQIPVPSDVLSVSDSIMTVIPSPTEDSNLSISPFTDNTVASRYSGPSEDSLTTHESSVEMIPTLVSFDESVTPELMSSYTFEQILSSTHSSSDRNSVDESAIIPTGTSVFSDFLSSYASQSVTPTPGSEDKSSSVSTVPTTSVSPNGRSTKFVCKCECSKTESPLKYILGEIKRSLTIDKNLLSKTVRKRVSIPDERPSAVAIGTGAIIFIAGTLFIITAADALSFLIYILHRKR